MLQNEAHNEPPASPSAQVRITPEELTQALAAIEGRKQAEARRLAGTIPIEEAVSTMHLDATPDDIWAEVQAQREAALQTQAQAAQREQARRAHFGPTQTQAPLSALAPRRRRPWVALIGPAVAFFALYNMGVFPHTGHTSRPTPPALTATAAQIPDGKQFYCDDAGLVQLSEGKPLPQVHVDAAGPFGNSWTLIKMAGHVYLRAYTLPLSSLQSVKGQPLVLLNDDNAGILEGERTAQTTVRVDGVPLQVSGGDDGYTQITLPQFQPDPFTTTSPWR